MNLLEYVLSSSAYLFFVGFTVVAINGFITSGLTLPNGLLFASGVLGSSAYGHELLTNPVNWYDEIF